MGSLAIGSLRLTFSGGTESDCGACDGYDSGGRLSGVSATGPGSLQVALTHAPDDQLERVGLGHQLPETLEETVRVRAELGYPIMVTPLSQWVRCSSA